MSAPALLMKPSTMTRGIESMLSMEYRREADKEEKFYVLLLMNHP